jgi:hypothetical protein
MPNALSRLCKRYREAPGAITVSLKKVERNALRRFLPNTRHATQPVNQLNQ